MDHVRIQPKNIQNLTNEIETGTETESIENDQNISDDDDFAAEEEE